jgi:hypothetical protein
MVDQSLRRRLPTGRPDRRSWAVCIGAPLPPPGSGWFRRNARPRANSVWAVSAWPGDERLRQLLVQGATAVIQHAKPGRPTASRWLLNLLGRNPRKLAAVALATKRRWLWQQNGPHCVGHDSERRQLPAAAGGRLIARLPGGAGLGGKVLIGRSDDPQNPCRVAASKVTFPFGRGSWNPSGPAAACRNTQAAHDRNRAAAEFACLTPCTKTAVHTRPTLCARPRLIARPLASARAS